MKKYIYHVSMSRLFYMRRWFERCLENSTQRYQTGLKYPQSKALKF